MSKLYSLQILLELNKVCFLCENNENYEEFVEIFQSLDFLKKKETSDEEFFSRKSSFIICAENSISLQQDTAKVEKFFSDYGWVCFQVI